MSYCRFGYADVYVFEHVHGYLECCGCALGPQSYHTTDVQQFLSHLEEHRAVGDDVPTDVSEEITQDWRAGVFTWAAAPDPSPAEQAEIDRFGIFEDES